MQRFNEKFLFNIGDFLISPLSQRIKWLRNKFQIFWLLRGYLVDFSRVSWRFQIFRVLVEILQIPRSFIEILDFSAFPQKLHTFHRSFLGFQIFKILRRNFRKDFRNFYRNFVDSCAFRSEFRDPWDPNDYLQSVWLQGRFLRCIIYFFICFLFSSL